MSEQRTLAQKLLSVQKNIGALTKSANNPFFKSKYADLNQVLEVAKEALHPEGLFVVQGPGMNESGRYIETTIIDGDSGQSISCKVPFSGSEKNMQEIGAATTYGRRFGLVSLLALEQEDDDGNFVSGKTEAKQPARPTGHSGITIRPDANVKAGIAVQITEPAKPPMGKAVSEGPSRKTVDEKISLTSKVIIDSKRATQDQVVAMLAAYGVKSKSELNDDQARKLLTQLEEILNK